MVTIKSRHIIISLYRAKVLLQSEGGRTYLRYLWWLFDPLLDICLFYFIFGVMMQRGGPGFAASLLVGVVVARIFMNTTQTAPCLLIHNEHVLLSVYLPKYIFPLAHVGTNIVKFCIILPLFFIFILCLGTPVTAYWLTLTPLTMLFIMFLLGVSMILAGITPFFPDFAQIYPKVMTVLYWGGGVFFEPREMIPHNWLALFYANPLASFIRAYRDCLLYGTASWNILIFLTVISLLFPLLGYALLSYFDRQYPRLIAQ